jgi:hypothetical protein
MDFLIKMKFLELDFEHIQNLSASWMDGHPYFLLVPAERRGGLR